MNTKYCLSKEAQRHREIKTLVFVIITHKVSQHVLSERGRGRRRWWTLPAFYYVVNISTLLGSLYSFFKRLVIN